MSKKSPKPETPPPHRPMFELAETIFSPVDAAKYLTISKPTLYRLFKSKKLRPTKIGARTIVKGAEVVRYLASLA